MAQQLIESLTSEFEPGKYRDEYREKVLELIERKASGEEIAVQPEAPAPAKVPDLMAALEASLAAVKSGDGGGAAAKQDKADAKPARARRARRSPSQAASRSSSNQTRVSPSWSMPQRSESSRTR